MEGKYTLQFIVMIDGASSREEVVDVLTQGLNESRRHKSNSFFWRRNFFEAQENQDADAALAVTDIDAYLYFAIELQVTPIEPVDEDFQVFVAKTIQARIKEAHWRGVVAANFESRLDE